jgi:hypothetical protein
MGSLLILGAAAWVINPVAGEPDAASWSGVGIWAGTVALCALLLWLISYACDLLRVLAAMWRPLVLILAAAYLLFSNDQGRELGVGLMAEDSGWRLFFLFLALIYWGFNNWHTARLGLRAAFSAPKGDEKWLFWPPRLLGICAHLFAAINLSLAAANQPEFAADGQWLAWTAPFAIALATALVWVLDHFLLSERRPLERRMPTKIAAVVVAIILLGGIAIVAFGVPGAPAGFSGGTIAISASAIVVLVVISLLHHKKPLGPGAPDAERGKDNEHDDREIFIFTVVLFSIAFGFACATWTNPIAVGGSLGSMVVAYFAFGALLALVNAFEAAVAWTGKGVFGCGVRPRVVGAYVVVFLIGLAVTNAWLHPFHRVRPCDGDCVVPSSAEGFTVATAPDQRPTVAAAAHAWYEQAKAAYSAADGKGPVPMLIVATAGGGIRAAYWTATVLERLESDFRAKWGGAVRPYLFAISGVSGGSVGATAFDAALAKRDENPSCKAGDDNCPLATTFLTADFLAPALASLVFVDAPASFLPDLGQGDRARRSNGASRLQAEACWRGLS